MPPSAMTLHVCLASVTFPTGMRRKKNCKNFRVTFILPPNLADESRQFQPITGLVSAPPTEKVKQTRSFVRTEVGGGMVCDGPRD